MRLQNVSRDPDLERKRIAMIILKKKTEGMHHEFVWKFYIEIFVNSQNRNIERYQPKKIPTFFFAATIQITHPARNSSPKFV
jgi:hypothetical protein